jgi:hypothetical protein
MRLYPTLPVVKTLPPHRATRWIKPYTFVFTYATENPSKLESIKNRFWEYFGAVRKITPVKEAAREQRQERQF